MRYERPIVDRQVGRNAQLFARAIAREKDTAAERYPHLRILVSLVEQAHPEWKQVPQKDHQVAHLVHQLSAGRLDEDEVAEVVRVRDAEQNR